MQTETSRRLVRWCRRLATRLLDVLLRSGKLFYNFTDVCLQQCHLAMRKDLSMF